MNRQDKEAAATGTTPEYQRTGIVDITPKYGSNNSNQSNSSNQSSNNYSNSRKN